MAAGSTHFPDGHTAESMRNVSPPQAPGVAYGQTSENRTYERWEDPVLGINGEGRVTPIVPGCQQITTVIDPEGNTLIHNKIWRTAPGVEGGGSQGQRGIGMAPVTPHTVDSRARECTSCHATAKALGYGTHDGRYMKGYTQGITVDIMNEKGQLVTKTATFQIAPIPYLPMDLDQVVTREGEQLQTVGHHWPSTALCPRPCGTTWSGLASAFPATGISPTAASSTGSSRRSERSSTWSRRTTPSTGR